MSDFTNHGDKPIEFCGDQEGWIAVGSLTSDSSNSPCYPRAILLGVGLGPSGKMHPSNIAAMLTVAQATDLRARLTEAMAVDRPAPTPAPTPTHAPGLDPDAVERAERAMTPGEWRADFTYVTAAGGPVATCIGPDAEHDAAGIVALRNAAPALIAEVRALRRHYDAAGPDHNLLALLDLYHEREQAALAKLAEAKRLGLIAARVVLDDDTDLPAIAAALEAL